MQKQHLAFSEREVFLNSVPILAPLGKDQRLTVAELLEEVEFAVGETVIRQGDLGSRFFIIMEVRACPSVRLCLHTGLARHPARSPYPHLYIIIRQPSKKPQPRSSLHVS